MAQTITPMQALELALQHLNAVKIAEGGDNAIRFGNAYSLVDKAKQALAFEAQKKQKEEQEQPEAGKPADQEVIE